MDAYPRTMASHSDVMRTISNEWILRTSSGSMANSRLPERSRQEVGVEAISGLVASLTLPAQIENNERSIDQHRDEMDNI